MRVLWTPAAADDLEQIADYLLEQNPTVAIAVVRRIYKAAIRLKQFPDVGRSGRKAGTRELVISSLPYIVIYEVMEDAVRITRILHEHSAGREFLACPPQETAAFARGTGFR